MNITEMNIFLGIGTRIFRHVTQLLYLDWSNLVSFWLRAVMCQNSVYQFLHIVNPNPHTYSTLVSLPGPNRALSRGQHL